MSSPTTENSRPNASLAAVLDSLEDVRVAAVSFQAQMQTQIEEARTDRDQTRQELTEVRAQREQMERERDRWRDECGRQQAAVEALRAQVAALTERNRNLRQELLELHRDLLGQDLPTLVLRSALQLTGAEQGLFLNTTGEQAVAAVGLDDLREPAFQALRDFTRPVGHEAAPMVRNEPLALPNGPRLANLAAVPVAMKGEQSGVILVADKRSGPFTEEDTELLLSVGRHASVALENRRLHAALSEAYLSTIAVLADAIEAKDPYTRGHCEEVAAIAVRVAQRLQIAGRELDEIRYAALLHDVGKIGVSDGILFKPGKLLPEEFQVIKRHASIGSDLVRRVPSLAPIAPLILYHHEHFDGKGYPEGLSGDAIPLASRIIGAVDALDAMTSPRPYRDPLTREEALAELRRCAGGQFDPEVITVVEAVVAERDAQ